MFRRIRQAFNQGGTVTEHDAALSAPSYTAAELTGATGIPLEAAKAYIDSFKKLSVTGGIGGAGVTGGIGGIGGIGGTGVTGGAGVTGVTGVVDAALENPLITPIGSGIVGAVTGSGGMGGVLANLAGKGGIANTALGSAAAAFIPALAGSLVLDAMMSPKKGPEHYAADANQQFQQLHGMTLSELNDPVEGPRDGTRTGIQNTDRLMAATLQNALFAKERGGKELLHPALQGGITDLVYFQGPQGAEGVTLKSKTGGRHILGADTMREHLSLPKNPLIRRPTAEHLKFLDARGGGR